MLVTPGFVDLHTHYDAQLFWDPNASPSPLHGVTTVLGGNCGFSLAPMAPEHVDYISRMMARVEGMPLAALRAGVPWDWSSFGDWLGRLDGRIAVNAGFLVGHSTLRRLVMGGRAVGGVATAARTSTPWRRRCTRALPKGRSGSRPRRCTPTTTATASPSRRARSPPGDGAPGRCGAPARGHDAWSSSSPAVSTGSATEDIDFLATMSLLADRPVNWNVLGVSAMNAEGAWSQLAAGSAAAGARGDRGRADAAPHHAAAAELRARCHPRRAPGWREVFALPPPERMAALSDPGDPPPARRRGAVGRGGDTAAPRRVGPPHHRRDLRPRERRCRGPKRRARWRGSAAVNPFDALLDVVVADRAAHRAPAAHPRVRGGLGAAGADVAGPTGHRRWLRRRCPPRHHVRRHLLDLHAGRRGAGPRPARVGGRRSGS